MHAKVERVGGYRIVSIIKTHRLTIESWCPRTISLDDRDETRYRRDRRKKVHQEGTAADPVETVLIFFFQHFLAVIRIFTI